MHRKETRLFIHGIFLAAAGLFVAASPAQADFYLHHWEDQREASSSWHLMGEVQAYSTNQNFGPTGTVQALPAANKVSRVQSDVLVAKSLGSVPLTLYGRLSTDYVSLEPTTPTSTAFGLADQTVGANYHLLDFGQGFGLDAQLQFDFPAYNNTTSATAGEPFQGDGTKDITIGGFLTVPLSTNSSRVWLATAGLGYTHRSDSFSAAMPYSAAIELDPTDAGLFLRAGAYGFQSLKTDPRADVPGAVPGVKNGANGSFFLDAINPSILNLRAQAGYQVSPMLELHGTFMIAAAGQAAPAGMSFGGGVNIHLGGSGSTSRSKPREEFVSYALDAKVTRASDRLNLLKIDKGSDDGVQKGQIFDIFSVKPDGTIGEQVARTRVISVRPNESALQITEYTKEVLIEEGFIAKRPIR